MKLIDKDALVVEIEKLINEIYAGRQFDSLSSEQQTSLWYVKSIMSSINTFEVKEVDEVPANVIVNQFGNKYILSWSGLKEYDNFQVNEEIKILIPSK